MNGFTDIHHHIIYGIDDGAKDFERMAQMLRQASEDGTDCLIATPHITPGIEAFDMELFDAHLREAKKYCKENGLPLTIKPGMEVLYTPHTARHLRQDTIRSLAGTRYVLVEFLPKTSLKELQAAVEAILQCNYTPIIAHVERYSCLVKHPDAAMQLRERYALQLQVNASTVVSGKGFFVNRFIKRMLTDRQIDFVATDAHDPENRPTQMQAAYTRLASDYGEEYARSLTGADAFVKEMFGFKVK